MSLAISLFFRNGLSLGSSFVPPVKLRGGVVGD